MIDHCEEPDSTRDRCRDFCKELYEEKNVRSPHLLAAMVDLHTDRLEMTNKESVSEDERKSELERAKEVCCVF